MCEAAMVLVMDVSNSVTDRDYAAQVEGYARAFTSDAIMRIVVSQGGFSVAVVQFSDDAIIEIDWQVISNIADCYVFANQLRSMPRRMYSSTAMGEGIFTALELLGRAPCGEMLLINVTSDGESNLGRHPQRARDIAQEAGVRINAIGVITRYGDPSDYLRDNVATSNGFVLVAQGWGDFERAIRRKLVMELTWRD